jgi:outer membrane biosynthesis protein TonB
MRSRDVTIPLGLWICAALCAHFLFGTGGLVVGTMHDDRGELWSLARRASELASQSDVEFDVSMAESNDTAQPKALEPVPPPPAVPPSRVTPPPPEARRPPDEKPVPSEPKAKPAPPVDTKPLVVIPKPKEPSAPAPEPPTDHRIAVQQHVRPNQDDNPSARFLGNEANHVDNETAATQTSHDRDDEHPTPGGNHPGADSRPGDSERTRIAERQGSGRAGTRARSGPRTEDPGSDSGDSARSACGGPHSGKSRARGRFRGDGTSAKSCRNPIPRGCERGSRDLEFQPDPTTGFRKRQRKSRGRAGDSVASGRQALVSSRLRETTGSR